MTATAECDTLDDVRALVQNRTAITTAFVAFAVLSVFMIAGKDASTTALGTAGLIMFGGGGLGWLMSEFGSGETRQPYEGPVSLADGTSGPALIIPIRSGKLRGSIVSQAAFALGSLYVFLNPIAFRAVGLDAQWLFGGVAIVLGLSVLTALPAWKDRQTMLALTPRGLLYDGIGQVTFVRWDAVTGVRAAFMNGVPFVAIDAARPSAIERHGRARLFGLLERPTTGHDLTISLVGMAPSPEQVVSIVERVWAEARSAR
ncbi:MAG: hypothetical protein ACJ77B_00125 [Chloroflexota bacterium]